MYGQPSEADALDWAWVDGQLREAGTYWAVARGAGLPHPRPVWGVWSDHHLNLSIGSLVLATALTRDRAVTVHLDSGTDVVIVEGEATGPITDAELIDSYADKYGQPYDVETYGPLTRIVPTTVIAWRAAGWAGRDGFRQAGRWSRRATAPQPDPPSSPST